MFKRKKTPSIIIGIFFIIFGITAIINSIYIGSLERIFWFCYAGLILMGIGIISDNGEIVASQLAILTIPFIFWNIDFFYLLFTKQTLWGITNYFFNAESNNLDRIITFQHVFTLPLAYAFLFFHKPKRKDFWIISLIQIFIFYIIGILFTSPESNINCVFKSCLSVTFPGPYPITWFIIFGLIIGITSLALIKIFYKKK